MKLLKDKTFKDIFFSSKWRLWIAETWIYALWIQIIVPLSRIIYNFIVRNINWWYNDMYNTYSTTQKVLWFSLVIIEILITILFAIMHIFVLIKRAHDLWKKWTRLWYLLIPVYNIFISIKLGFCRWQKEDNEYWKYKNKKLPVIAYIILIIEFFMVLWWNIFWKKPDFPFRDRPFMEYTKWLDENDLRDDEWSDSFDEDAGKEFLNIVNSKLNCDCFWDEATEKPTTKLNKEIWYEIYHEFEDKLLEMAKDPKYDISNNLSE